MVTILISAVFRNVALNRGKALMWIPDGAALIRGQCLFDVWRLLEEKRYMVLLVNILL